MKVPFGLLVLVTFVTSPIAAGARDASSPQTGASQEPAPVLDLRLIVSGDLPGLSRQALKMEATSIWRSGNVRLRWLSGTLPPDPAPRLNVLVAQSPIVARVESERWTVGELLRLEGSGAMAVASISGAHRVLAQSQRFHLLDPPAVYDHRLGIILGRALAHEIGHFLLHTNTHAADGLMRANIGADEFANAGVASFRLDPAAQAHLLAVTAEGPGWLERTRMSSFSYSSGIGASSQATGHSFDAPGGQTDQD
jgi:hypothetical protein